MGKLLLHLPKQEPLELSAGHLLALDCGTPHDVEALEESAFLLTVFLTNGYSETVMNALVAVEHSLLLNESTGLDIQNVTY